MTGGVRLLHGSSPVNNSLDKCRVSIEVPPKKVLLNPFQLPVLKKHNSRVSRW